MPSASTRASGIRPWPNPCRPNTVAHRIPAGTPESASPLGEGKSGGFLESLQVRPGGDDSLGLDRKTGGLGTPPVRRREKTAGWGGCFIRGGGSTRGAGDGPQAHHERAGDRWGRFDTVRRVHRPGSPRTGGWGAGGRGRFETGPYARGAARVWTVWVTRVGWFDTGRRGRRPGSPRTGEGVDGLGD